MAWIYLAESQDSQRPWTGSPDQSPIVKMIDMLKPYFCLGCGMAGFQLRLSGTISDPCKDAFCPRPLISSGEASRARTSALRALERAWMESEAAFSLKSSDSFVNFDRNTSVWKTRQESLLPDSSVCSLSSYRWGTIVDGLLFQPKKLEPRFSARDGSSWPRPCASDTGTWINKSLSPRATDGPSLGAIAKTRRWPRPLASDGEKGGPNHFQKGDPGLSAIAARWASPTARDWKGQKSPKRRGKHFPSIDIQAQESGHHGYLNPVFHAVMMGFPEGWLKLDAVATPVLNFNTEKPSKG